MDKPLTYEAWKQAQTEARAKGWKLSNCFFLPAELKRLAERGCLSLQEVENGLFLLEDCGSFFRCYYLLSATEHPSPLQLDREAVVEFPFTGELNPTQRLQIGRLQELGFVLGRESGMMTCAAADVRSLELDLSEVRNPQPDELPEIDDLLRRSFDPRFAFLPAREEIAQAAADGMVFSIFRDGHLAAILVSGHEKNVATVHQITVDEVYRGRGLGKLLLEAYHRHYAGIASTFRHWVDLHNAPALAMYRAFGYEFSLRKANEYILAPSDSTKTEGEIAK